MQEEKHRLTVSLINRRALAAGCVLIAFSLYMPVLFTVDNVRVLYYLRSALINDSQLDLVNAALRLTALNSLRALPHYVGAFLVTEAMEFRWKEKNLWILSALLTLSLLYVAYWSIGVIQNVYYDFGLPAMAAVLIIVVFDILDYRYISVVKRIGFIAMSLIMLQFLDIMPAASFLPVGRGEISHDIRLASLVLDADSALNGVAATGGLLFAAFAALFFILLRDENRLREMESLREQNNRIRTEARLKEMENRTYWEMRHLVHDLKSPLTVVQTLVGVLKMECEQEQKQESAALLGRVENSVDQMSQIISEILYEEKTHVTTVGSILRHALAQLSIETYASCVHVEDLAPAAEIRVNCVLFPRALVNLVQNAARAIPEGREPDIRLRSECQDGWVLFRVSDNGKGIEPALQQEIWNRGYSGSGSSGLGLSFVRGVVESIGGKIDLHSVVQEGTAITLWIPEEGSDHGFQPENDDPLY